MVILVLALSFALQCSWIEVMLLLLLFGWVISLELINTAVEHIANFISPNYHEKIKIIKDIAAAAAVLVSALIAFGVGTIIFISKLTNLVT